MRIRTIIEVNGGLLTNMGLFSLLKNQYVQNIEWMDTSSQTLVQQAPLSNRSIMMGAELTVREFQDAVVVNDGKVADVFGPGKYILTQESLPVLSTQKLWKSGVKSAFRADVYYVSTKLFTELMWESVNPLIIKSDNGDIPVRARGTFTFRVLNAEKFMKVIFGSNQIYDTSYIIGQCKSKLISALTHTLDETRFYNNEYAARYEEISERTTKKLQQLYEAHGLELCSFIIEDIIVHEVKELLASTGEVAMTLIHTQAATKQVSQYKCSCSYTLQDTMKYCPDCGQKVISIY